MHSFLLLLLLIIRTKWEEPLKMSDLSEETAEMADGCQVPPAADELSLQLATLICMLCV